VFSRAGHGLLTEKTKEWRRKVNKYSWLLASFLATILIYCAAARAQSQQRPIMETLANKVIQRYQQASCEQLSKQKEEPKKPKEQEALQILRNDPQLRTAFINKVAAPIANKLFECRLIP